MEKTMVRVLILFWINLILIVNLVYSQSIKGKNTNLTPALTVNRQNNKTIIKTIKKHEQGDEELELFVEFHGEPHVVKVSTGLRKHSQALVAEYQNTFNQFESDLHNISATLSRNSLNKKSIYPVKIQDNFYKAIHGSIIITSKSMIPYIAALHYVKNIYPSKECKPQMNDVVDLIKATNVWNHEDAKLRTKGQSAIIGILDSAFDINHPDLKQSLWTNQTEINAITNVDDDGNGYIDDIYGYDFADDDGDPRPIKDSYAHGTHVAGIVSAKNSGNTNSINGVAPESKFIACKIAKNSTSSQGGEEDKMVKAIEYCMDINQDGFYEDAVDVINISYEYNYLSQAVNNAINYADIVVVTSAGNSRAINIMSSKVGPVITVGWLVKEKNYSMSCHGPIDGKEIGPDLTSIGDDIYSTFPFSKWGIISGSSMSSPTVAGVCALIRSVHPEWTVKQVTSAIKTTAEELSLNVMKVGGGLINAKKAIEVTSFIDPTDLYLGYGNKTRSNWIVNKEVTVTNINTQTQTYEVSSTKATQGISITAAPTSFTLNKNQKQTISFTFTLDQLALTEGYDGYYTGRIKIDGSIDELYFPWAYTFHSLQRIKVNCSKPIFSIYLKNKDKIYSEEEAVERDFYSITFNPNTKGNYDLYAVLESGDEVAFVIKENYFDYWGQSLDINVNFSDAIYDINFDGKDESGNIIFKNLPGAGVSILFDPIGGSLPHTSNIPFWYVNYNAKNLKLKTSAIPSNMVMSCNQFQIDESKNTVRILQYPSLKGLQQSVTLTNQGYTKSTQVFSPSQEVNKTPTYPFLQYKVLTSNLFQYQYIIKFPSPMQLSKDDYITFHGQHSRSDVERFQYNFQVGQKSSIFHITPPLKTANNISYFSWYNQATPDLYTSNSKEDFIRFGEKILFSEALLDEGGLKILFKGQNHETQGNKYQYHYKFYNENRELFRFDSLVAGNKIMDFPFDRQESFSMEYYLKKHFPGIDSSQAKLTMYFNKSSSDWFPPSLTSLQIRNSNGIPRDHFPKDEKISIRFSLKDNEINLNKTIAQLSIKIYNKKEWQKIALVKIATDSLIGNLYLGKVDLSTMTDSGLVSLKIDFADQNKNMGQWLLSPAFSVGNISLTDIYCQAIQLPKNFRLYQNYPNPFNPYTRIQYSLPAKSNVVLQIFDLRGRLIKTLMNKSQEPGNYNVPWNGKCSRGTRVSSGIYFYRIIAKSKDETYINNKKMVFLE